MVLTKLDAINACLRGIGLAPVATEETADLDAATASSVIDQVSNNIQSRGWWFNKEWNWKLTPDPITGYILVPNSALSIITTGASRLDGLTIRDGKIYDLYNHTYDLSSLTVSELGSSVEYIEFVFITELSFSDLPPVAKMAITYRARREFAQDIEIDERRWKFQKTDEEKTMSQMLREDARTKKLNYVRDNGVIASFLSRAGGPNSGRYQLGYFPRRNV